jgi:hypothetical protein
VAVGVCVVVTRVVVLAFLRSLCLLFFWSGRYVGKCTVVTGGSKGIGEGCVRVFFEAGSNVVFCSRGQEEGDALAAELNANSSQGQRAVMVKADVSKVGDSLTTRGAALGHARAHPCDQPQQHLATHERTRVTGHSSTLLHPRYLSNAGKTVMPFKEKSCAGLLESFPSCHPCSQPCHLAAPLSFTSQVVSLVQ